jgi:hypothetical protein
MFSVYERIHVRAILCHMLKFDADGNNENDDDDGNNNDDDDDENDDDDNDDDTGDDDGDDDGDEIDGVNYTVHAIFQK